MVPLDGRVLYTDRVPAVGALIQTDKAGPIIADDNGTFSFEDYQGRDVRLSVTVSEGKFTYLIYPTTSPNQSFDGRNLCIPR